MEVALIMQFTHTHGNYMERACIFHKIRRSLHGYSSANYSLFSFPTQRYILIGVSSRCVTILSIRVHKYVIPSCIILVKGGGELYVRKRPNFSIIFFLFNF